MKRCRYKWDVDASEGRRVAKCARKARTDDSFCSPEHREMARMGAMLRVGKLPRGLTNDDAAGVTRSEQRRREAMLVFEKHAKLALAGATRDQQELRMRAVLDAARDFLGKTFARQIARRMA